MGNQLASMPRSRHSVLIREDRRSAVGLRPHAATNRSAGHILSDGTQDRPTRAPVVRGFRS